MSNKTKGWIYVLIQGLIFTVIVISSVVESRYFGNPYNSIIHAMGLVLIALGILLFLASLINFGQLITANPVPKEHYTLRRTGLYGIVRHPMYFSLLILFTGVVLYFEAYISFIWVIVLFVFFIWKTSFEEKFLMAKFPDYTQYRLSTKRLIPFIY